MQPANKMKQFQLHLPFPSLKDDQYALWDLMTVKIFRITAEGSEKPVMCPFRVHQHVTLNKRFSTLILSKTTAH